MAVTISLYNHTRARFASGDNPDTHTYKVKLLTAASFNATHTTMAATGGTEVANGNGYTTGGAELENVTVTIVNTNEARWDADDVIWTASGGSITASYGILYNDVNAAPLAFIDFDGIETAGDGTQFKIIWSADGIVSFAEPA